MRVKSLVIGIICLSLLIVGATSVNVSAIFGINPTVRNGSVTVNDSATPVKYIATYNGNPYYPLNLAAGSLYIQYAYDTNNQIATFSKSGTVMKIDFKKTAVTVNNAPYTLLLGVSKKVISGQTYIFLSAKDIQDVFGVLYNFNEEEMKIELSTGFGILDVLYSAEGGFNPAAEINQGKTKSLNYANTIASKLKGTIEKVSMSQKNTAPVDALFGSINGPMTKEEFTKGIKITGLTSKNAKADVSAYLKELRFLSSLANVTIVPEYLEVYTVKNTSQEVYVVSALLCPEGIEQDNQSLSVATIASVEDTFSKAVSTKTSNELSIKTSKIADKVRKDNALYVFVIKDGNIGAIERL